MLNDWWMMMNFKWCRRKMSWLNLKCHYRYAMPYLLCTLLLCLSASKPSIEFWWKLAWETFTISLWKKFEFGLLLNWDLNFTSKPAQTWHLSEHPLKCVSNINYRYQQDKHLLSHISFLHIRLSGLWYFYFMLCLEKQI